MSDREVIYLESGQFVTAAGFLRACDVYGPSRVVKESTRYASVAEYIEFQLKHFGPNATIAIAANDPFIMLGDKVAAMAEAERQKAKLAKAITLKTGDIVQIEGVEYVVKVNGESYVAAIAFTRTWPKMSDEEVEKLKRDWRRDPHWDVEGTEGFVHHYSELKAYREGIEAAREAKEKGEREARIAKLDTSAGLNGNRALAEYIIGLEDRIEAIDGYTDDLYHRVRHLADA